MKIAIVGNVGLYTAREQKKINEADIVVRFNNYATRANIEYTTDKFRCDILFSTFDLHSHGSKPKDVIITIPFPFKADTIVDKVSRWYPQSRPWMVNPYLNMLLCKELGLNSNGSHHPLPSAGFTALWHMAQWKAEFYIAGFSWYYSEETGLFQNHHLSNKNYPKTWNHSYPSELIWIIKNLVPKNNIYFSENCERLLKIAEGQLR